MRIPYEPRGTVRCEGTPMFRTQAARDAACLADLDPTVAWWYCLPLVLERDGQQHLPDLALVGFKGRTRFVDVVGEGLPPLPDWVPSEIDRYGYEHVALQADQLPGYRLDNARELLRYARWRVSLNDRIRLLAALEQEGSLPIHACLAVLNTPDAMAAIASLALKRFVEVEVDEAPIGPNTRVRAIAAAL